MSKSQTRGWGSRGWLRAITRRALGEGHGRERLLLGLLDRHYRARFRRAWLEGSQSPHFGDHRVRIFELAFSELGRGPYMFGRAFFCAEILRPGDVLLDIGCGAGFFTKRFFAERSAHIDAIDIEPSAIETALRENPDPKIKYELRDAVTQEFPRAQYDVIVWDGAIGHFSPSDTTRVLQKIRAALAPDGAFVGSESLGREGSDHLQYFQSPEDMGALFKPHFPHVLVRKVSYRVHSGRDFMRHEAYWRCALAKDRFESAEWRELPG